MKPSLTRRVLICDLFWVEFKQRFLRFTHILIVSFSFTWLAAVQSYNAMWGIFATLWWKNRWRFGDDQEETKYRWIKNQQMFTNQLRWSLEGRFLAQVTRFLRRKTRSQEMCLIHICWELVSIRRWPLGQRSTFCRRGASAGSTIASPLY